MMPPTGDRRRGGNAHDASPSSSRTTTPRVGVTGKFPPLLCLLSLASLLLPHRGCQAVLPTAALDVYWSSDGSVTRETLLASQASFGSYPAMGYESNPAMYPALPPNDDQLLCDDRYIAGGTTMDGKMGGMSSSSSSSTSGTARSYTAQTAARHAAGQAVIMFVPRGKCSFEKKSRNAQAMGASAIVIYGTLGARYDYNESAAVEENDKRMIWPIDKFDYDCSYGEAKVSASTLSLNPYVSNVNDDQLTGTAENGNLCAMANPTFNDRCTSQRCLLTGNVTSDGLHMVGCCAWDLHIWLYGDSSLHTNPNPNPNATNTPSTTTMTTTTTIQAYYVTMEQGHTLLEKYHEATNAGALLHVVPYARPRPTYNISAVLIWALGVFVAGLASWLSASEYRGCGKSHVNGNNGSSDTGGSGGSGGQDYSCLSTEEEEQAEAHQPLTGANNRETEMIIAPGSTAGRQAAAPTRMEPPRNNNSNNYTHQNNADETLELSWHHAILFLVFSSASLFILFFFKIYNLVKIMYGIGCSGAVSQVIFIPLYTFIAKKTCPQNYIDTARGGYYRDRILFHVAGEPITLIDTLAVLSGYGVGIAWIITAFVHPNPNDLLFFWVTQNIMGISMCIIFLGLIRLNSIKVATILLLAAFIYDIFFVFITPLIFSSSVMITVATSGGPPTADPTWCEKYPDDLGCQGGDPLPMLFTIPRIGDYQGGSSLLGLGDVVLPGLLLSFACRYDAAKRLVGLSSEGRGVCVNGSSSIIVAAMSKLFCCFNGGYFVPVLVAYAIGLMMANLAVYLMNMGQPALLYLVPMCLGTMCAMGLWKGEMRELWNGPRVLSSADRIASGESAPSRPPTSEDMEAPLPPTTTTRLPEMS